MNKNSLAKYIPVTHADVLRHRALFQKPRRSPIRPVFKTDGLFVERIFKLIQPYFIESYTVKDALDEIAHYGLHIDYCQCCTPIKYKIDKIRMAL